MTGEQTPRGSFWQPNMLLAAKHASPVFELLGEQGLKEFQWPAPDVPIHTRIGYHLRSGDHDVTAYDWRQYLAFADRHLQSD